MERHIPRWKLSPVPLEDVTIEDSFWAPRIRTNRAVTIPHIRRMCEKTGRIGVWNMTWKPGHPSTPHVFWDSDVAKWMEAVSYCLAARSDPKLKKWVEKLVERMARAQMKDGYLNSYYMLVEPEKRWTNLRDCHELYCAGHLMEAAVAHHRATGKQQFLRIACRLADHIERRFGRAAGERRGYDGHPEIELALVKLFRATGDRRYLALSKYFVEERGRRPWYFDREARLRGENPGTFLARYEGYRQMQAHLPVRKQRVADGHAVRAMYLFSGMADLAAETGDRSLWKTCERLWDNVVSRRMYITGGVGSSETGERFTGDYDLPNENAYAETCAAIGLIFWAHRMLRIRPDRKYADVMERALYNGFLSGVSLDGKRFFYANHLAVYPDALRHKRNHVAAERQEWLGCACCPPNIARLLASFGDYVYSVGPDEIFVHLYVQGSAKIEVSGQPVILRQKTRYPWGGAVSLEIRLPRRKETVFTLALRIPAWARKATVSVNRRPVDVRRCTSAGYVRIRRAWKDGDRVNTGFPLPVERIEAHPAVRDDAGRIALQRGPVVYCFEEADNGTRLNDLVVPRRAEFVVKRGPSALGKIPVLHGWAVHRKLAGWDGVLYRSRGRSRTERVRIAAVPYCLWNNRGSGEMLVWMRAE